MADRAEARSRGDGDDAAKEFLKVALSEGEIDAEIKRLAELPEGVYESNRKAALERLPEGWRGGVLDRLVKAERSKIAKVGNDFLPHWKIEPWPEPVDGAVLLDELRKYLMRYAALPKHADVVLALWPLHTWVFDCFDITPYLAITSPTRRCGKTLLMTLLHWLCCRGKKNDSMSKAAIYRSVEAERPTLILDEVSWVLDLKDERQGILCGGFERLGYVETCEGEGANIVVRRYATFCPKAFGLIGKLTPTLMDRSIEIAMQRKTRNDKIERLRRRDNGEHVRLRQQCSRWAKDNRQTLTTAPKIIDALNDRAFDIWEPLLAIAERVGGDWPRLATEAAIALSGDGGAAEEISVELLRDIEAEFDRASSAALTTKTLIAALCADEERPWATYNKGKPITDRQLGKLLTPFEIISETVHPYETAEAKDLKGYKRERFENAFSRYLTPANDASPEIGGSQASCRPNADETGITSDFFIRPKDDQDGNEKCEKPANDGHKDARTDKNSPPDDKTCSGHQNGGEAFPQVCVHCGAPATSDSPIQACAVDGEEFLLHRHCQAGWLNETNEDLVIPEFLRRAPAPDEGRKP
jgi:putative DNA primase/helicase